MLILSIFLSETSYNAIYTFKWKPVNLNCKGCHQVLQHRITTCSDSIISSILLKHSTSNLPKCCLKIKNHSIASLWRVIITDTDTSNIAGLWHINQVYWLNQIGLLVTSLVQLTDGKYKQTPCASPENRIHVPDHIKPW